MPILWDTGDVNVYRNMCQEDLVALKRPRCFICDYPSVHSEHKIEITQIANDMVKVLHQAVKACFQIKSRTF